MKSIIAIYLFLFSQVAFGISLDDAKDFRKADGKSYARFSAMKKVVFARKEKKTIIFKNISIVPVPNSKDKRIFKVSFFENYKSSRVVFNGDKELYIELIDNEIKILIEK